MGTNVPFDIDAAGDLTDLSIQEIWPKTESDKVEYHRSYFNVESVTDLIVKDSSVSSISTFSKIPENGLIPADSPHQGFDQSYTQSFFAGMLRITRPMWRYGLKPRKLQSLVLELRNDANRFREQVLANVVENIASTSYIETSGKFSFTVTNTGGDGAAGVSTSHQREDGGSNWNNQVTDGSTVNMDFDYDALKAARRTASLVLGPVGEILDVTLDTLLCKKDSPVHHRAEELLKALAKGERPDTANRDGSIDFAFKIVPVPYLTTAAAWAMFDSSKMNDKYGFQVKEGMPLTLDPQFIDYDSKEIKYSAGADFAYGFNDLRYWVFSDGTNA